MAVDDVVGLAHHEPSKCDGPGRPSLRQQVDIDAECFKFWD